jgi:hypothetical protein
MSFPNRADASGQIATYTELMPAMSSRLAERPSPSFPPP